MCKKYNVDAYISGHKHIQAHLVSNDDYGLNHVITGIVHGLTLQLAQFRQHRIAVSKKSDKTLHF